MVSLSILPLLVVLQQPTSAPSVASPAPVVMAPASDRLRPVRWSLLAVSIAADVQTTYLALSRPGTREANPLMRGLVGRPVVLVAAQSAIGVALGRLMDRTARRGQRGLALGLAVGIAAVHGVAAANNYRIYRQKGGQ